MQRSRRGTRQRWSSMYVEESYSLVWLALVIIHTCLLQVVSVYTMSSDGKMMDSAERTRKDFYRCLSATLLGILTCTYIHIYI